MPSSNRSDPGTDRAKYPGSFLLAFRAAAATVHWTIERWHGDAVACVDAKGERLMVGLENLYRRIRRQDRGDWPRLIAEFLTKVNVSGKVEELKRDLTEVADRLLLRLGPPFPPMPGPKVWNQPLDHTGLVISLVIDHEETMSYVTEEMIENSGAPGGTWLQRAVTNLIGRTPGDAFSLVQDNSDIRLCTVGDAYDSSRALIAEHHLPETPHGYFIAIPSRDELMVLPMQRSAIETLPLLKMLTAQNHQKSPYPVSDELFWVYQGTWHRFPIEIKGKEVNIRPPEEFLAVLDALKD
jgi:hypothetical protein